MKYNFYVAAFLLLSTNLFSQAPDWQWAKSLGGSDYDDTRGVTSDISGNVYTTGYFSGTVDLDPDSINSYNLTSMGGAQDIYISKLDSSGHFIWALSIGGTDNELSHSIVTDPSGNIYLTGSFAGTVDFDPGPGIFSLTSGSAYSGFILKLNSAGSFIWAKGIIGLAGNGGGCFSLAMDSGGPGDMYITGYFQGTMDFDPDPVNVYPVTPLGLSEVFVLKLDHSGNFLWMKSLNGSGSATGMWIAIDEAGKKDIYFGGNFDSTVDFNPDSTAADTLAPWGGTDVFICKWDSAGKYIWAGRLGGAAYDFFNMGTVEHNGAGNIYLTGAFSGTADFDPDTSASFNLTSAGTEDLYLCKLDSAGNFVWAKSMGGINYDGGSAVALDKNNELFLAGYFDGTADLDPDPSVVLNVNSVQYQDAFYQRLDTSGNLIWMKQLGGLDAEWINGIAFSDSNNAYIIGGFQSPTLVFDSSTIYLSPSTGSNYDSFVARLHKEFVSSTNEPGQLERNVSLYPNPAKSVFTIHGYPKQEKATIEINDLSGRQVAVEKDFFQGSKSEPILDISKLPAGLYFVRIQSGNEVVTKKLVVTK